MDIDNLRAFVAVAESGSFSSAAGRLHLTQPAVSKRVAALEQQLAHALFDRLNRRVYLTQAGRALLPQARGILKQIADAKRSMADLSGNVRGELKVATSHHMGLHKLPPVLRTFASAFPEVNLQFEFLDSEVALQKVLSGHCELAAVTLPPSPSAQLLYVPLWLDQLVFVTGASSPLPHNLALQELAQMPAILPDLNTYTGRLVKRCFDEHELPIQLNMTTNYLETIKMMVSVGLGWSVLPRSMLDANVRAVTIEGVELSRTLGVAVHHKRHLSNAAQAFYEVLCANGTIVPQA